MSIDCWLVRPWPWPGLSRAGPASRNGFALLSCYCHDSNCVIVVSADCSFGRPTFVRLIAGWLAGWLRLANLAKHFQMTGYMFGGGWLRLYERGGQSLQATERAKVVRCWARVVELGWKGKERTGTELAGSLVTSN